MRSGQFGQRGSGMHLTHRHTVTDPAILDCALVRPCMQRPARALGENSLRTGGSSPSTWTESGSARGVAILKDIARCFALVGLAMRMMPLPNLDAGGCTEGTLASP